MTLRAKIENLSGPVLIIGASGFVGANLLRECLEIREDVVGTIFSGESWRLHNVSSNHIMFMNLLNPISVRSVFSRVQPKTIFDCSSFGAYSFEEDFERIHSTNYLSFIRLMEETAEYGVAAYIHAGSSSEYGLNAASPGESDHMVPNSHYAVSKAATSQAIAYYGKVRHLPVVNLRLYSVYGPYEDSSRLMPVLCKKSLQGELPSFARAEVSRDFIHIDDVVEAFIDSALLMSPDISGESFNIGTGIQTSLLTLASLAQKLFDIDSEPEFNLSAGRAWDVDNWYADTQKSQKLLGWEAKIKLEDGLLSTRNWWAEYLKHNEFSKLTKKHQTSSEKNSVSAIIACYKDAQAIPIMYERLINVFTQLKIEYEIIFVNDDSPDDSAEIIRELSARDPHVIGITHSRNFGSQAAFRSGMEIASKEACVLLDGDLQDPPEVIEEFVQKWREGADVVYGRRVKREMSAFLEACYKGFYRIFSAMSEIPIPKDAGDFSLMDSSVVYWMLQCHERDVFLRGLRAYVGFKQVGVDYVRPERMFGVSTNNWIKNFGWAKKGIFSFSRMPLHLLTALGGVAFIGSVILALVTVFIKLFYPESVPKGVTYLSLLIMCFGSAIILSIGLLGEYIGKIFEETKARPAFIQKNIIVHGEVKQPTLTKKY
ncbi:MAG: NAD-dependent epimerase/dehydratase family protein [Gammaproteobacteria bacterium]|nr:NAD-dependent epimerase/dehydratase family protein [Gammaproteobacteria bacterium]